MTADAPEVAAGPATQVASEADVWAHQERIGRQLAAWALASLAVGAVTAAGGHRSGRRAVRAFGGQTAAWAAIDLGIATFGELRRRGRLGTEEAPYAPATQARERAQLRRILRVNAALDVGNVTGGAAGLAWALHDRARRPDRDALAGHCAAVVVQGGFLLAFDTAHARQLGAPSGPGA